MNFFRSFAVISKLRERILQIADGTVHIGLTRLPQLFQKVKILFAVLTLGVSVQQGRLHGICQPAGRRIVSLPPLA